MRIVSVVAFAMSVLMAATSVQANSGDLNIYGFMSVGVGILDENTVTIEDFEGEGNFKQDTLLALQVTKQVNDSTTATGQLISRGTEDFKTKGAWAFVSFAATEDLTLRMGRLRIPFFYYSEFLEVGYAYNWVRLPSDVYNLPFSSVDGVDLIQNFSFGSVDGSVQLNYGRQNNEFTLFKETYNGDMKNMAGISLNLGQGNWGIRLGAQQTEMTIDSVTDQAYAKLVADAAGAKARFDAQPGAATGMAAQQAGKALSDAQGKTKLRRVDQAQSAAAGLINLNKQVNPNYSLDVEDFSFNGHKANFYSAALSYDNGSFSFFSERTQLQYESGLLVDNDAWLASVAQRFSATTIHLTYSTSKDALGSGDEGKLQEALKLQGEDISVTLGLRYDYDVNTALKFEAQNHDEIVNRGVEGDHAMLYSFAVDVIF